ncbi:MAG: antitoxin component YwqK of YwqJK toxin-antitoxin module [Flavobacteriaceae bacterium]|jgi:antitoxin component YwqK of YwqJK toxin-antitoxin module
MKISVLFLFSFIISTSVGFSQNEINQIDSQGKRHGIWKKNFKDSEQVRYEGEFDHGKEIGVFKFYCEECETTPAMTKSFNENDLISEVKYFSKKGNLISEGNMKGKVRIGPWVYYHNGTKDIMTNENYNNGELDGKKSTYYKTNVLAEEINYNKGIKVGKNIYYSPTGIVLKNINYVNNELHGEAIYYDALGNIVLEGFYKNGKKNGVWKTYEEGVFIKEESFPKY